MYGNDNHDSHASAHKGWAAGANTSAVNVIIIFIRSVAARATGAAHNHRLQYLKGTLADFRAAGLSSKIFDKVRE